MDEIYISAMVDTGTYNKKERTECPKKTLSKKHVSQSRGRPVKRYTTWKKPRIRQQ